MAGDVRDVDVVVVGLGPGGEATANKLGRAGLRVVGVERHLVGGECPFYGCGPSKVITRAGGVIGESRRVPDLAGESSTTPLWSVVADRIRARATHDWDDTAASRRLERSGVTIVRGHGRLTGPNTVEVDGEVFRAARGVVLSPGTAPSVPPVDGLAGTPYWTNREVMTTTELPGSLAVVGAGAIGCELAQALGRLGVRVTLLDSADRILAGDEPEVSAMMTEVFAGEGIRVLPGVQLRSVSYSDGAFTLDLGDERVVAEKLLVATGREVQLTDLGLEHVGLDPAATVLDTDSRLRVLSGRHPVEGLWALGDAVGRGGYTHTALYQAAIAARDILREDGPEADYRAVPRVTFTDPEVGSVGMTEAQARDAGRDVRTGLVDLRDTSRAGYHGARYGLVKLVAEGDLLVGATSAGPMGGEVLGMLTTAVHARVPISTLSTMMYAYPTFHQAVRQAISVLE